MRALKKRQPTETRYAPTTTTLHQFFEMPVALFSLKNTRRTVFRKAAEGDRCLIFLFLLSLHCAIALLSTGDELKPIRGFFSHSQRCRSVRNLVETEHTEDRTYFVGKSCALFTGKWDQRMGWTGKKLFCAKFRCQNRTGGGDTGKKKNYLSERRPISPTFFYLFPKWLFCLFSHEKQK